MNRLRQWMDVAALCESVAQRYEYLGNCTDQALAPYLDDMMAQEKKVRYKEVYQAVGRPALSSVFSDFFWGSRPNRLRGDMALHQDPYVSFYKSKFRGVPCYFVQESGIEYVFVAPKYFTTDWDAPQHQAGARRLYVQPNGTVSATIPANTAVSVVIAGDVMQVVQSTALNPEMSHTLLRLIKDHRPKIIDDDGEKISVDDYIAFLMDVR